MLLQKNVLYWHYGKLMDHDLKILSKNIKSKEPLFQNKFSDLISETSFGIEYKIIKCISQYFKEEMKLFFQIINVSFKIFINFKYFNNSCVSFLGWNIFT